MLGALPEMFAGLGWGQVAALGAALVLAALMRSFTGFGFALAAVPVLSLFLAPGDVVVLIASLTVTANLLGMESFRRDYPPLQLWPLLLTSVFGTMLGVYFLRGLSATQFQLAIGIAVLLAAVIMTLYRPRPAATRRRWGAFAGLCSGLMNGAFAIPGPPVVIFAMASEREPARSRALLMYFFTFSALIALVTFAAAGYVGWHSLYLLLLGLPAMLIGDQLGLRLFRRFGDRVYRRVALLVLYAIGAATAARGLLATVFAATA
jgi:uncharacterized membrane protein YfcA